MHLVGGVGLSLSAESIQKRPSVRRSNSRDKRHYLHRSSSRRNKENGSRSNRYWACNASNCDHPEFMCLLFSFKGRNEKKSTNSRPNSFKLRKLDSISRSCSFKNKAEICSCTSPDETAEEVKTPTAKSPETICVTLTYKPRV